MAGSRLAAEKRMAERAEQIAATRAVLPPRPAEPVTDPVQAGELALALGAEGYANAEIAAYLDVSEERMKEWEEAHPAFADAITRARARAKAWWLSKARESIRDDNNRFPAGAWQSVMRALYPEFDKEGQVVVNLDMRRLVMVDLREPGLLGEQGVIDAKPLPTNEPSDFRAVGRSAGSPLDPPPPTPIGGGQGGAGEKREPPDPNTGRSPNSYPPPPINDGDA